MVYYKKSHYKLLGYEKSNKPNKMYNAILQRKNSPKIIRVPFGSTKHENYHDLTGLNLYPHLIHGDKKRRRLYRSRAKGLVKDGYYSPSWFSLTQLW